MNKVSSELAASFIYCYPPESNNNLYITQCKKSWERIGVKVDFVPNTLSKLLFSKRRATLVLNWYEDRLGYGRNQIIVFLKSICLLVVMRLFFLGLFGFAIMLIPMENTRIFFIVVC